MVPLFNVSVNVEVVPEILRPETVPVAVASTWLARQLPALKSKLVQFATAGNPFVKAYCISPGKPVCPLAAEFMMKDLDPVFIVTVLSTALEIMPLTPERKPAFWSICKALSGLTLIVTEQLDVLNPVTSKSLRTNWFGQFHSDVH